MKDDDLVARARQGDTGAFGELVERHQAAVLRTVLIVCRSRDEADDLAQDAFIQAWQKLDSFRGEAQFKTWLLTIAWRHALSRRRAIWTELRRFVRPDQDQPVEAAAADPSAERQLAQTELVDLVQQAVDRLPERMRRPLLLAAAGDCTFEEMAGVLGVPSGTLKWRVMEARRTLKRDLAARGIEWL